jgi:glycosyltransferase involved in cell wall biosynthesis
MRVNLDSQIFAYQSNGGISRYFLNLLQQASKVQGLSMTISPSPFFTRCVPSGPFHGSTAIHIPHNRISPFADSINRELLGFSKVPDLYHSTYYDGKYLRLLKRAKHVMTVHDMIPEDYPQYFPVNPHQAKAKYLQAASHIICVSEFTRKRLLHYHPDLHEKTSVIHHGVDDFWSLNSPNPVKRQDSIFRIVYIGRRDNYKNFGVLIEAVGLLHEAGIGVEVIALGGSTWTNKEMKRIEELRVNANFRQRKASDLEMRQEMNRSNLFVSTSLSEGFGLPILEAMSSGLPTLLSDIPVSREIAGDSSFYFSPKSAEDLARNIMNLVQNPALLKLFEIATSKLVLEYSWKTTFSKTFQVYEKVLHTM